MTNISQELNVLLADYQVLYQKLRTYHWTVYGPEFFQLHAQFELLYTDAALKADEVAERLLTLGHRPLGTLKQALEIARIKEDGEPRTAAQMVDNLITDFTSMIAAQRQIGASADETNDRGTANMMDAFSDAQEKTVWMLRAVLARPRD